jgi:hypothetical protein
MCSVDLKPVSAISFNRKRNKTASFTFFNHFLRLNGSHLLEHNRINEKIWIKCDPSEVFITTTLHENCRLGLIEFTGLMKGKTSLTPRSTGWSGTQFSTVKNFEFNDHKEPDKNITTLKCI